MKLLVDMNLTPAWCPALAGEGFEAVHWIDVGDPRARDEDILTWAFARGHVVLTHDLDFGALLAHTGAGGPSVIQIRTQDPTPDRMLPTLADALRQFADELAAGALIVVEPARSRARVLPLRTSGSAAGDE